MTEPLSEKVLEFEPSGWGQRPRMTRQEISDEIASLEQQVERLAGLQQAVNRWNEFNRRMWELDGPTQIEAGGRLWKDVLAAAIASQEEEA